MSREDVAKQVSEVKDNLTKQLQVMEQLPEKTSPERDELLYHLRECIDCVDAEYRRLGSGGVKA